MATSKSSEYYDILLLGRTGKGKSSTGNKLLKNPEGGTTPSYQQHWVEEGHGANKFSLDEVFKIGMGIHSETSSCKLVSNEDTKVRVLDTPGFADSRTTKGEGVIKGNLPIFRGILNAQARNYMAFSRILYFLPQRGPLEKAEGTLQEELTLIKKYLGIDAFNIMVVIITTRYKPNKQIPDIDDDDIESTRAAFMDAINTGNKVLDRCPPILYVHFNETNILNLIQTAPVLIDKKIKLACLLDRCIKCSARLVYSKLPSKESEKKEVVIYSVIINESGRDEQEIPHEDSKCHPLIISRHSRLEKVAGGVAHMATLGTFVAAGKIRGKKIWPGFTNSEEICASCNEEPSSEACTKVDVHFKLGKMDKPITTAHSNIIV